MPFVSILMGSSSDKPQVQATLNVLDQFGIVYEHRVLSAHRTPDETKTYVQDADKRGCAVFIAAAGMAAHLAGAVAATTIKPVIGIPMDASLNGLDALLSTVQMPGGVPVATVAIGKAGAKNAAYLALQILGLSNPELQNALLKQRQIERKKILAFNT